MVPAPYVGDRVLEVGAGTGNMSVHLMPRSVYWATDVNSHYLDYLVTLRATRPSQPGICAHKCDK